MSSKRKAVTLAPAGVLSTREKLWRAMRELKTFRVPDLARRAGVDRSKYSVSDYLRGLLHAGIIRVAAWPGRIGEHATYTLVQDMGVEAPRVRRDGSVVPEPAQQAMWRAMRVLREFSARDLVANAAMAGFTLKMATAASYCTWLARGGYLRSPQKRGEPYRLVKDTGPKAPQILHVKQLYDPNTGKIMAGQTLQEAVDAAEGAA
ncbi:MAG: hypothetical protein HDR50_04880 [Desulfovibrio sp.]|uniref:hypothetical protein n=1 Tax=Desulfovibrio sp. TaxID=885 RepID=UPI001A67FD98|nr:hypothetical protein [Desulfovibrio sp.]MBD5416989.1 hypothetical protein [Desulfovibrio sp.]